MVFFDLNIPHLEGEKSVHNITEKKNARLKAVVKAMELGYTGVAYNRSMKGVMSDSDRCTIAPFPVSSLLKAAPSLSASVKFHRELLGVPLDSPFRQYTRLTVFVDSVVQCAALNSGNPVLKTYDIIAVRPLNQNAFEQACKVSEVDLIAIDFSDKMQFRLKLPMVKAAIERGIYFEVTYSHLISDIQARRQMITNAKLLIDWTRGKNLIFSSAASSAAELRGPYDVANLSSLLGLSMERAKLAISKNCSSLIARALRKKQFFKEAIRVERILPSEKLDPKEPWFTDSTNWDPISSGEGDLSLDDIAKFFSASCEVPKTSKSIDFVSIAKELPSKGMKLNDWLSVGKDKLQAVNSTSLLSASEPSGSQEINEVVRHLSKPQVVPVTVPMSLFSTPLKHPGTIHEGIVGSFSTNDTETLVTGMKEIETVSTCCEEPKHELDAVSASVETIPRDTASVDHVSTFLDDVAVRSPGKNLGSSSKCIEDLEGSNELDLLSTKDEFVVMECDMMPDQLPPSKELDLSFANEASDERLYTCDATLRAHDVNVEETLTKIEEREQPDILSIGCVMSTCTDVINDEQHQQRKDVEAILGDDNPVEHSRAGMQVDVPGILSIGCVMSTGTDVIKDEQRMQRKYVEAVLGDDNLVEHSHAGMQVDVLRLHAPEDPLVDQTQPNGGFSCCDVTLCAHNLNVEESLTKIEEREQPHTVSIGCVASTCSDIIEEAHCQQDKDVEVVPAGESPMEDSCAGMQVDVLMSADSEPMEDPLMEDQTQATLNGINHPTHDASKSGKARVRKCTSRPVLPFPFPLRHLLKPVFKKKSKKLRKKTKTL